MKTKYIIRILGVRKLVRLGDKMVDWNDSFRLFLFSRSTVPTLSSSPQSYAMVNVINFNTTEAGLSEQVSLEIGKILIENFDCSFLYRTFKAGSSNSQVRKSGIGTAQKATTRARRTTEIAIGPVRREVVANAGKFARKYSWKQGGHKISNCLKFMAKK